MPLPAAHYAGREQALVKHHFLKHYLQSLIHKIASTYDEVVYVDGFSGPWQHRGEAFEDTSFGIALKALTEARQSWASMKSKARLVRMTAHLVEKDATAHGRLAELKSLFPNIKIITHNADFVQVAADISRSIPSRAFSFVFVDPKGFSLDLKVIRPLIARDHSEIVFNFMFDFINRFALSDDAAISSILDRLIPDENWREPMRALDTDPAATPLLRKRVLVDAFERAVSRLGRYPYVADVDVQRPNQDRTLYFLVYGSRQPAGIQVFRDCQIKSLGVQSDIIARKKVTDRAATTNQFELLGSMHDMAPDPNQTFLAAEYQKAREMLLEIVPPSGEGMIWSAVWPKVLARHVVRKTDLNRAANEYRKDGNLVFSTWSGARKSVPEDDYLVLRGSPSTR